MFVSFSILVLKPQGQCDGKDEDFESNQDY